MALLSDLLDRVHDELPAVPEALALRALSDATKEFCSRTHIWQAALPRLNLRAGVASYTLYPDTGTQIVALKDVRYNGQRLDPAGSESLLLRRVVPTSAAPSHYTQPTPDTIELSAAPAEDGQLTLKAAVTLALNATETDLPDSLVDEHAEALAAGAKMRLARQSGQPWTAPDMAVAYGALFYNAVAQAKRRAATAMDEAEMRVEMRSWS